MRHLKNGEMFSECPAFELSPKMYISVLTLDLCNKLMRFPGQGLGISPLQVQKLLSKVKHFAHGQNIK